MNTAASALLPSPALDNNLLAELPIRELAHDRAALRRAALRTLGRRASIQPHVSLLVEDAIVLALEAVQGNAGAVTQLVGSNTLWTRWARLEERGQLGDPTTEKSSLEESSSIVAYAMKRAEAVVVGDLGTEVRFLDGTLRKLGGRAGICAPIFLRSEIFGALTLSLPAARTIDDDETEFVESIISLLATAIARAKAERELEQMRAIADQSAQILRDLGIDPPSPSPCSEILLFPPDECAQHWPGDDAESAASPIEKHISPMERRTSHRKPFRYWQQIGPVVGGMLPARKSFFPVLCCDISAGGISMELESPPEFTDAVVQLGPVSCPTYLMARVAHVTEIVAGSRRKYHIGCRFTGRLQL